MRGKLPGQNCTGEGEHDDRSSDEMNANCWVPPANRISKQLSPAERLTAFEILNIVYYLKYILHGVW